MENRVKSLEEMKLYEKRQSLVKKYIRGLLREMALGSPRLEEFFDEFDKFVTEVSTKKFDAYMTRAQDIARQISRDVAQKTKIEANLKRLGIKLTNPIEYRLAVGYFKTKDGTENTFELSEEYNGVRLTRDVLTPEGLRKLKENYERIREHNIPYDSESEALRKSIEQNEKKIRHAFIREKKKTELIEEVQDQTERINFIKARKREENIMAKTIEFIEGMNSGQRSEILKYLDVADQLIGNYKAIEALRKKMSLHKISKYNKESVPEAFDGMVEQQGLTDEDITAIYEIMKSIERKTDGGAYNYQIINKRDADVERKYKGVAEGFLQYVYEPEKPIQEQDYFVKRRKAKEETEPEGEEH